MITRRRMDHLNPAQQAGILCKDARFQAFAASRVQTPADRLSETATAEFVRRECRVTSRRELTTDAAALRFAALRTEFDAWRGRIAKP